MNYRHILSKNLKNIRTEEKISQEKLSYLAGLNRTYISDIETGKKSPSLDTLEKISNALKIKVTELLSEKDLER